jgi:predicted DNA-binding transcriptional regulator AlpA
MTHILSQLFSHTKTELKREKIDDAFQPELNQNFIKMKEAMQLLKASAPTIRKYARLGFYNEYRFGEKLVFYNKQEIIEFITSQSSRNPK